MRDQFWGHTPSSWLESGAAVFAQGVFSLMPGKSYPRKQIRAVMRAEADGSSAQETGLNYRETELIRLVSFVSQVLVATFTFAVIMLLAFAMGSLSLSLEDIFGGRTLASIAFKAAGFLVAVFDAVVLIVSLSKIASRSLRPVP
jgi:hypothetical protein